MKTTATDAVNAARAVVAIAEAIREAGSIPAGTLYAHLMGHMDLSAFERVLSILTSDQHGDPLVTRRGDLLVWTGPEIANAHGRQMEV